MEPVSIKLYLGAHCIETAAKKELYHLTNLYFNSKNDYDNILQRIELLQVFIEKSDFRKLRSNDERLSGAKEATVIIFKDNKKNIVLDFDIK